MRAIKFRAWHKTLHQMKECFAINFAGSGTVGVLADNPTWPFEDIDLMQFTGLHDKKGKEIWDGDIIKYSFFNKIKRLLIEHEFSSAMGTRFNGEQIESGYRFPKSCEVVGNIYSTPELLSKSQSGSSMKQPFKCPVCLGSGNVPVEFYHPTVGNIRNWGSFATTEICRACKQTGIIWSDDETAK